MSELVILLGKICCSIAIGILAGHGAVYVFNKIPAEWLCDVTEQPDEALKDKYTQRVKGYPWKWIFSAFFAAGLLHLMRYDWVLALAGLVSCWALLEVAIADSKYRVIPDPFVLLLAISAMGFVTVHENLIQILGGIALGGGIILLFVALDKFIFKRNIFPVSYIKLFTVLGLTLGFRSMGMVLSLFVLLTCVMLAIERIRKRTKPGEKKPLGAYISSAAIIYIVVIWPLLDVV